MKLYFDPDVGGMSVADARANQVQATPPSIAGAVLLEALLDAELNQGRRMRHKCHDRHFVAEPVTDRAGSVTDSSPLVTDRIPLVLYLE